MSGIFIAPEESVDILALPVSKAEERQDAHKTQQELLADYILAIHPVGYDQYMLSFSNPQDQEKLFSLINKKSFFLKWIGSLHYFIKGEDQIEQNAELLQTLASGIDYSIDDRTRLFRTHALRIVLKNMFADVDDSLGDESRYRSIRNRYLLELLDYANKKAASPLLMQEIRDIALTYNIALDSSYGIRNRNISIDTQADAPFTPLLWGKDGRMDLAPLPIVALFLFEDLGVRGHTRILDAQGILHYFTMNPRRLAQLREQFSVEYPQLVANLQTYYHF